MFNETLFDVWAFTAAVIVTMAAYGLHRARKPKAPKHHTRFLLAAAVLTCLGSLFVFYQAGHFTRVFVFLPFFCAAGYAVYRLVMLTPEKPRKWMAVSIAGFLSIGLILDVYSSYQILAHPCCVGGHTPPGITEEYQRTFFDLPLVPCHGRCHQGEVLPFQQE